MKTLRSEGSFINLLPTSAFHTKLRVTVESTIANLERNLTMNVTAKIAKMTDEQFERWMKRNGYTGLAAVRLAQKRREALAA
jgi:plasmid maintenance system antidote protein VapI